MALTVDEDEGEQERFGMSCDGGTIRKKCLLLRTNLKKENLSQQKYIGPLICREVFEWMEIFVLSKEEKGIKKRKKRTQRASRLPPTIAL